MALFDVWWVTALAERIPPDKLSRVTSYDWMLSLGLVPLGICSPGPGGGVRRGEVLTVGSAIAFVAWRRRCCRERRGMLAPRWSSTDQPAALERAATPARPGAVSPCPRTRGRARRASATAA